jgi:hypothetical protein
MYVGMFGWMYTLTLVVTTQGKMTWLLLVEETVACQGEWERIPSRDRDGMCVYVLGAVQHLGARPCHLAPESLLAWPGRVGGWLLAQALMGDGHTGDGVGSR